MLLCVHVCVSVCFYYILNFLVTLGLSHMTPPQEERMRKSMKVFCDVEDSTKAPKSTQVVDGDSDVKSPVFIPPSLKNFIDETWYVVMLLALY